MRKIILILIMGIFFISLVSAELESIGASRQGESRELFQTCNNCTFCNFTKIKNPNNVIFTNVQTTQDTTYFNYTLDGGDTLILGHYQYCYDCGNSVERQTGCINFNITADGKPFQQFPTQFIIIILALFFIIFGLYKERYRMFKYLGSIIFLVMGVLTLYPGYSFINWTTLFGKAFGFSLVGLGFYFLIEDSFSREEQQEYYDQVNQEHKEGRGTKD